MPLDINGDKIYSSSIGFEGQPLKQVVTSGVISYLDAVDKNSYPGSGSSWTDLFGLYNAGLNGGYSYTSDKGAIILDGGSGYINVGTFQHNAFTICLWVYPGATQNTYADIFDNSHTGTQNFVCQQNGSNTNQYAFDIIGSSSYSSTGFFTLPANQWSFICFSWDGSRARGYLNGSLFGTGGVATVNWVSPYLRLGAWWGFGTLARFWNGRYGTFIAYNRTLSDSEVLQNYRALRGRYGV